MPDWNQDADVALLYKSVFGIYDSADHSGTKYNFDSILEVEVITQGDFEKYYSATGKKRKKIIGDSSTYRLRVKKTADLYDTVNPATNIRTVSYFQKLIMLDRITPIAAWEGVSEAEAATNKFLRHQFTGVVEHIEDVKNQSTGALEVEISGEVLTHVKHQRQAS